MGAMFIGQQFLQNVLGYSTLDSGLAILPAAGAMVIVAPRSAKLVETRGARFTLLIGYVFCLLGFLTMLLLWKEGISYWKVGLGYALIGVGVGFAGTPASHSLTGSVPVQPRRDGLGHRRPAARPRRGDHAVDPRRPADRRLCRRGRRRDRRLAGSSEGQRKRRRRADQVLLQRRRYAPRSTPHSRSRSSPPPKHPFCRGTQWAYTAGIIAVRLGAALVFFLFPKHEEERSCWSAITPKTKPPRLAGQAAERARRS